MAAFGGSLVRLGVIEMQPSVGRTSALPRLRRSSYYYYSTSVGYGSRRVIRQ